MNSKNKLLNLVILTSSIVPLSFMISCSASPEDEKPNVTSPSPLSKEVEKFNVSTNTILQGTTASDAINMINLAPNPFDKTEVLKTISEVPTLSSGFGFEVLSANINPNLFGVINVVIKVFENKQANYEYVTYQVTGFSVSPIEIEASKFVSRRTLHASQDFLAVQATQAINSAAGASAKLRAFQTFAVAPTLSPEFGFEILSAEISTGYDVSQESATNITVKVFEISNPPNFRNVTFTVHGFWPFRAIDYEWVKFSNLRTTLNSNITADEAAKIVESASSSTDRLEALKTFANVPTVSNNFSFLIQSVTVPPVSDTELHVSLILTEHLGPWHFDVIFVVTGFKPTIRSEAAKFGSSSITKRPEIHSIGAVELIELATIPEDKKRSLSFISSVPIISDEYEFEVMSAKVNQITTTTVDVTINLFEKNQPTNNLTVLYQITQFDLTQIEIEGEKFKQSVQTTSTQIDSSEAVRNIESSSSNEGKLVALRNLAPVPIVSDKFDLEIISARLNQGMSTSIEITIRIFEKNQPTNNLTVVYNVTGFRVPNIDAEVPKFQNQERDHYMGDFKSVQATQSINSAVGSAAKLAAFKEFAIIPTLSSGFAFEVSSARTIPWDHISSAIDVYGKVYEISNPSVYRNVAFCVYGFEVLSPVDYQWWNFADINYTLNNNISAHEAAKTIELATNYTEKLMALQAFANVPVVADGYSFKINSASVPVGMETELHVSITLTEEQGPSDFDVIFVVAGFKPPM
ncbi:MAG: hypothetical protein ACRC1F_02385 [Metamycoplasmataceae bacterium]